MNTFNIVTNNKTEHLLTFELPARRERSLVGDSDTSSKARQKHLLFGLMKVHPFTIVSHFIKIIQTWLNYLNQLLLPSKYCGKRQKTHSNHLHWHSNWSVLLLHAPPFPPSRVQIPAEACPGDSFLVTSADGEQLLNVIVPPDVEAGSFMEVTVPELTSTVEASTTNPRSVDVTTVNAVAVQVEGEEEDEYFYAEYKITKATVGAAIVGGVVGLAVLGPIGGVAGAGVAAYCTTRKEGKIGSTARDIGRKTYRGISFAKNKVQSKVLQWKNEFVERRRERRERQQNLTNSPLHTAETSSSPTVTVVGIPVATTANPSSKPDGVIWYNGSGTTAITGKWEVWQKTYLPSLPCRMSRQCFTTTIQSGSVVL